MLFFIVNVANVLLFTYISIVYPRLLFLYTLSIDRKINNEIHTSLENFYYIRLNKY